MGSIQAELTEGPQAAVFIFVWCVRWAVFFSLSLSASSCKMGVDGLPGVTSGLETGMAAWSSGSEHMTGHTPGSPLAWAQGQ